MKIVFYNPAELDRNLKATVHKTGKLGFTVEAANKMKLNESKSISIGRNEDVNDENLYAVVNEGKVAHAFSVNKAGQYYYLNTKALFDSLKWDYMKNTISFEISESDLDGQTIFVFKKKQKAKKAD